MPAPFGKDFGLTSKHCPSRDDHRHHRSQTKPTRPVHPGVTNPVTLFGVVGGLQPKVSVLSLANRMPLPGLGRLTQDLTDLRRSTRECDLRDAASLSLSCTYTTAANSKPPFTILPRLDKHAHLPSASPEHYSRCRIPSVSLRCPPSDVRASCRVNLPPS